MTVLFDTSILVSALVASHSKHAQSLSWLKKAHNEEFEWAVAAHSLLECYAVLTKLPLSPKISPAIAKLLIEENVVKFAKIISLSSTEYFNLLKKAADLELTGGIIYDAIIMETAKKIKANKILTLNLKDFHRVSLENTVDIISA